MRRELINVWLQDMTLKKAEKNACDTTSPILMHSSNCRCVNALCLLKAFSDITFTSYTLKSVTLKMRPNPKITSFLRGLISTDLRCYCNQCCLDDIICKTGIFKTPLKGG